MILDRLTRRQASPPARRARGWSPEAFAASRATWLHMDTLEARTLLSTIPVFKTYTEGADLPGGPDLSQFANAPALDLAAMQRTALNGSLPAGDSGDVIAVSLAANQLVTVSVASPTASASALKLQAANSAGAVLATNTGLAIDPDTGLPGGGPALSFRSTAAGTYLIAVSNNQPATAPATGRGYALNVRPIAPLASPNVAAPSGSALDAKDGGMYAVLQAGRLNIVGPTGYGFGILGNWTSISTNVGGGQTRLTFVANAGIKLDTGFGQLPMPLPRGGSILITTKPGGWGTAGFGEIDTTKIVTGLAWLDALVKQNSQYFGSAYTLPDGSASLDVTQGTQIGLALGSTIANTIDVNAPVNPAVPYLYIVASAGVTASFGNASVSGAGTKISVIVDPADPSVYVGAVLPGIPIFASAGIGLSWNGLIPLNVPGAQVPTQFSGTFRGHAYLQAEVNIPIPQTAGVASVNVNGKVVLNIDANRDHLLRDAIVQSAIGGTTLSGVIGGGDLAPLFALNPALINDLGAGAYGKLGVTISPPLFPIISATFTVAQGTVIATGTNAPAVYFHGQATNNLATGTFLEPFMSFLQPTQTFTVDGAAKAGTFTSTFSAQYAFFGSGATIATTIQGTGLNGNAPQLAATLSGTFTTLLGASNAQVTGYVDSTGYWQLNGNAGVTLGGFTLSAAAVTIDPSGIALGGLLNLGPIGTVAVSGAATANGQYVLTGTLRTNFGTNFLPQVDALFTLTNAGLAAGATVAFLGQQVNVQGVVLNTTGSFKLNGSVTATVGGFALGGASVEVVPTGFILKGSLNLGAIGTVAVASAATTGGNFVLTGTAQTNFGLSYLPQATGTFTLSNSGLSARTTVSFLGQQASLSGAIQSNLDFSLTGTVDVGFSFTVGYGFFSFDVSPSATVNVTLARSNGTVSLGGTFNLAFSVAGFDFSIDTAVFLSAAGVYSGSATVKVPGFSPATVQIANNVMVVDLPLIPKFTINLPF